MVLCGALLIDALLPLVHPSPRPVFPPFLQIVEYMDHHRGVEGALIERPIRSRIMSEICQDPWDADFIDRIGDRSRKDLYDLILAANYMDMQRLLYIGCAKVATWVRGQPLDRIRAQLAIEGGGEEEEKGEEGPPPAEGKEEKKTSPRRVKKEEGESKEEKKASPQRRASNKKEKKQESPEIKAGPRKKTRKGSR